MSAIEMWNDGGTIIRPGYCGWHGYHGMQTCPSCSSCAPLPLPPAETLPAQQGWQCPVCKSVMAPFVTECLRCAQPPKPWSPTAKEA